MGEFGTDVQPDGNVTFGKTYRFGVDSRTLFSAFGFGCDRVGDMKRVVSRLSVVLVALMVSVPAWSGTTTTINITSSGLPREFIVYVPTGYDGSEPTPLLFMMHGLLSSGAQAAVPNGPYRWQDLADQEGFIVLFPSSYQDDSWDMNATDADFVRDMISWSMANYNIRTTHIFTTGHSMGAFFSYYIAVALRNDTPKISAFAEHSGGIIQGLWPIAVPGGLPQLKGLLLHSSADSVVPYSLSVSLDNQLTSQGHVSQLITLPAGLDHNWDRSYNETQWEFFLANASSEDPPQAVPSMSPVGLIGLAGLLLGFGLAGFRMSRRPS